MLIAGKIRRVPPLMGGLLCGAIVLLVGFLLAYNVNINEKREDSIRLNQVLSVVESNIETILNEAYTATMALSLIINEQGEVVNFEETGDHILEHSSSISHFSVIPNGIIQDVYPREGREGMLGVNILEDSLTGPSAVRAMETRTMNILGPIELRSGGTGMVARWPVYKDDNFWGFTSAILHLNTIIQNSGLSQYLNSYNIQISKIDPSTNREVFVLEEMELKDLSVFHTITFPEGEWKVYAEPISGKYENAKYLIMLFIFGLSAFFVGLLTFKVLRKPYELEVLLTRKTKELVESRERFKQNSELLNSVFDSPERLYIITLDKNYNYLAFNHHHAKFAEKEFGIKIEKGMNLFSIYSHGEKPWILDACEKALEGHSHEYTKGFDLKDGTKVYYQNWFNPHKDKTGKIIGVTIFSIDVTEKKESDKLVEQSLHEKTTLLAEIHHRVKNNLAIVSGLLELQKSELDDENLDKAFDQSINRIISIAMVHELMYQTDELSSVNVQSYLEKLIPAISQTFQSADSCVEFDLNIESHKININQAIPLGLLLNELITNSYKYAFVKNKGNKISVDLNAVDEIIMVRYSDNGVGYNSNVDFNKPKNLGLNLIHAQLQQLDATYEVVTDSKFLLNFTFNVQRKGSHSNIKV